MRINPDFDYGCKTCRSTELPADINALLRIAGSGTCHNIAQWCHGNLVTIDDQ